METHHIRMPTVLVAGADTVTKTPMSQVQLSSQKTMVIVGLKEEET